MKARIVNFRGGYKQQPASNHIIVMPEGTANKEAAVKLVSKSITWSNAQGTAIKGKIAAPHGRNGCVRAIMEKGLPGQALGSEVKIE